MNIFSFGKRRSKSSPPAQPLQTQMGFTYRPALAGHPALVVDWFNRIRWPNPNDLDEFKVIRYEKIIKDFGDRLTGRTKWFDICDVDAVMRLVGVNLTPATKEIYDNLRCLHCVHYENIPPHIVERMPDMLNAIFSEGDSLTTVEGEVVREEPKQLGVD